MKIVRIAFACAVATLLVAAIAAPRPAHAGQSKALKCAFAKQRAAVKKIEALLDCEREALRQGVPVDPQCTAAAHDSFDARILKIEMRGGCQPAGDGPQVEFVADQCSERLAHQLQGQCGDPGEQCGGPAPPCCTGLVCRGVIGQPPVCSQ